MVPLITRVSSTSQCEVAQINLKVVVKTRHTSGDPSILHLQNGRANPLLCSCHFFFLFEKIVLLAIATLTLFSNVSLIQLDVCLFEMRVHTISPLLLFTKVQEMEKKLPTSVNYQQYYQASQCQCKMTNRCTMYKKRQCLQHTDKSFTYCTYSLNQG